MPEANEPKEERVQNDPEFIGSMIDEMLMGMPDEPKAAKEVVSTTEADNIINSIEHGEGSDDGDEQELAATEGGSAAEEGGEEEEEAAEEAAEDEEAADDADEDGDADGSEPDRLTALEEQNARLTQLVQQLTSAPAQTKQAKEESVEFDISDDDFYEATTNKDGLKKVVGSAMQFARQQTMQEIVPVVQRMVQTQTAVAGFFARPDNEDLRPFAQVIAREADAIQATNPQLDAGTILQTAGENVRKYLNIRANGGTVKQAAEQKQKGVVPQKGAFAQGTGKRKPAPVKKKAAAGASVSDQIDQMMNIP